MQTINVPSKQDVKRWVHEILKGEIRRITQFVLRELKEHTPPTRIGALPETDSVTKLDLSVRVGRVLDFAGIRTIGELRQKTPGEMLKYQNFGKSCLMELEWKLARAGHTLKMPAARNSSIWAELPK
jgi:DNA-directed RNA polymerase alpha subunit